MTVLSDTTIRAMMQQNRLILDGRLDCAKNCSYDFRAARVVYGGTDESSRHVKAVELDENSTRSAIVPPTAVVWVRSRERVQIPEDMVGLWIQTNSLSRKGLLLLNSTLVEPGYQGFLSAHFANLGSIPAVLTAETTIAKLVFIKLDTAATELINPKAFAHYDALVDDLAVKSNASFLRIQELLPDLKAAALGEISITQDRIDQIVKTALDGAQDRLLAFEKKTFYRVGGGFALGLCLAVAFAIFIYPTLRTVDNESKDRITAAVKEENALLGLKIDRLQHDLELIQQRGSAGNSSVAVKPSPADPKK
jgi:deoxycytidine triphosphate deaminase